MRRRDEEIRLKPGPLVAITFPRPGALTADDVTVRRSVVAADDDPDTSGGRSTNDRRSGGIELDVVAGDGVVRRLEDLDSERLETVDGEAAKAWANSA